MEKKILKSMLVAIAGVGMMAGTSLAAPITSFPDPSLPGLGDGYEWSNNDYWTLTDFSTGSFGNSNFQLLVEEAGWESDFGLYIVDDITNPTSVVDTYEIFDKTDEPGTALDPTEKAVYFNIIGSDWYVDSNDDWSDSTNKLFDNQFGFYFTTNTGYTWYSDMQFNNGDGEHIAIAYNSNLKKAQVYLDDQPSSYADHDWKDMVSAGDDLQPIPEPTTMLLFGTGLIGLAGVARRKKFKNN